MYKWAKQEVGGWGQPTGHYSQHLGLPLGREILKKESPPTPHPRGCINLIGLGVLMTERGKVCASYS